MNKHIHLYVANMSDLAFKVGITHNPRARMASLRTGSPFAIELVGSVEVPKLYARFLEQGISNRYDDRMLEGEWFSYKEGETPEDVLEDVAGVAPLLLRCYQLGCKPTPKEALRAMGPLDDEQEGNVS
jgi:hypothetical protein